MNEKDTLKKELDAARAELEQVKIALSDEKPSLPCSDLVYHAAESRALLGKAVGMAQQYQSQRNLYRERLAKALILLSKLGSEYDADILKEGVFADWKQIRILAGVE